MILYAQEDNIEYINREDIELLKAELDDLFKKIANLDNNLNRKDFSIRNKEGKGILFEKFLAKEVLKGIRKTLTERIVKREKNIIVLEEKFKEE